MAQLGALEGLQRAPMRLAGLLRRASRPVPPPAPLRAVPPRPPPLLHALRSPLPPTLPLRAAAAVPAAAALLPSAARQQPRHARRYSSDADPGTFVERGQAAMQAGDIDQAIQQFTLAVLVRAPPLALRPPRRPAARRRPAAARFQP